MAFLFFTACQLLKIKWRFLFYAWSGKKYLINNLTWIGCNILRSSQEIAGNFHAKKPTCEFIYGLFIKEDLFTGIILKNTIYLYFIGQSGQSETFDNEVLSGNKNFKIKDIEVINIFFCYFLQIWAFDCY